MSSHLSEEQVEFRDTIRRFLEERAPIGEVRRLMETSDGCDDGLWKQMASELGLQGIAIDEACGGQGFGPVELGIVMQELGRSLACVPYFSSVAMAAAAVACSGDDAQQRELLGAIAAGERATLALAEPRGRWDAAGVSLVARPDGDALCLDGVKSYVVDGHSASRIIVVARAPGTQGREGIRFAVLDANAAGLERRALQTLDRTRKLAELRFDGVRATPLGPSGEGTSGADALDRTRDLAGVALCNEMIGGMEKVLESAVAYAQERVQFGRPIGSFQAVKHRCADMQIALEAARTATADATGAAAEGDPDFALKACVAQVLCSDAYFEAAHSNIQVHGGVGFTWEYDAHLYFRRAKSAALLLGDASAHREELLSRLGASP